MEPTTRFAGPLLGLALVSQLFGCGGDSSAQVALPVTVSVAPASALVAAGDTQVLNATVQNDSSQRGVTWAISPASGAGALSDVTSTSVTYHAPATAPPSDLPVTITATAVSGQSSSASATITVPASVVSVAPDTALVPAGSTQGLTATVLYDPGQKGVTWAISPTTGAGTLSAATSTSVTYNAPATPPPSDLGVTITATSISNTSTVGVVTITVPASIVSITPSSALVPAGSTQGLTATVLYDPGQTGVTWAISPLTGAGTLSAATSTSVTYSAPASAPASNLPVTITATSINNGAVSASATITVPAIGVSVAPVSALIPANASQTFKATVSYDPTTRGVTWALSQGATACSPACGTVTSVDALTAAYSAPATAPTDPMVTLAAMSITDPTKSATAAIAISNGTVQLAPTTLNFGNVNRSRSKVMHVTLTNAGAIPLTMGGISITGTNSAKFSQSNTCGMSVAAAASCDIAVTFAPNGVGSFKAALAIADSSIDSPQQIPLSGVGCKFGCNTTMAAVRSALAVAKRVAVPAPTGPHSVGTRVLDLIDAARDDPYLASGAKRELLVRFWYPASVHSGCKPAPYTDPAVWSYFSELVGVALPTVRTNSCLGARILDGAYPVVIFTHGYTGTFTDYTFLFEDLASRGYLVASIDHTYEATAVAFADGRLAKSVFGSHLQKTVRADEQALSFAESVRLRDVQFVVGELARLNGGIESPFAGHLDTASIAVAGHSLGGLTALSAVQQDPRIRAAIFIEGLAPGTAFGATDKPVLILDAGREQWSNDEARLWHKLQGPRFAVNLKNAEHVTPTDAVWLAPGAIQTGNMSPEQTVAAVREYIAAFLDANLQGRPVAALLVRPSLNYPDADVGGP